MTEFSEMINTIQPLYKAAMRAARERQDMLAKPPGSLGHVLQRPDLTAGQDVGNQQRRQQSHQAGTGKIPAAPQGATENSPRARRGPRAAPQALG